MKTLDTARIAPNRWVVPSRSTPGRLHSVVRTESGFSCTCDGCMFTGRCAHIDAIRATQPEPTPPAVAAIDPAMIERAQALGIMARPRRAA